MKTKVKKFSHKLLALFLAVLMALTCFSGVLTAYGSSNDIEYYDGNIEYNGLAWSVLSDEQVATALLDYADSVLPALKEMEPTLAKAVNSNPDINSFITWDIKNRKISILGLAEFQIMLGSVDELLQTVQSLQSFLNGNNSLVNTAKGYLGDVKHIDLSACNGLSRSSSTSCNIVRGVLGLIYKNTNVSANQNGQSVIYKLLDGSFNLGSIGLDIYGILGNLLHLDAGYQSDLIYNLVKSVLLNYTGWFTDAEIAGYKNNPATFKFDTVLLEKMTNELLQKISVLVTYPDGTSSESRKYKINELVDQGYTYEEAAESLGYDPNLVYSTQPGFENNILLFAYGSNKISLTTSDSLFSFGKQALKFAWNTVLKDTVKLVHVNYKEKFTFGGNFDNNYYYWAKKNITWNVANPTANYSAANVEAWANAEYAKYGAESAQQFLDVVKASFTLDRSIAEDAEGRWSDIDSVNLFDKMRYSPLADYYFNIQTGPINLYLMQMGTPNLDNFFNNQYDSYSSLVAGINDCLVAAVKDLFPDRANIYVEKVGDKALPNLTTTGNVSTKSDSGIRSITTALVNNTLKVMQYVGDTTDRNILNGFYKAGNTTLSESNLEGAMIPLLISCIGNVNLGSGRLDKLIHTEDWNACKDAEAVAFVCLREYLSHVIPSNDYNQYITRGTDADKTINATLEGTILPMARDAVVYVAQGYVPITDKDGNIWKAENPNHTNADFLDLLNSIICYYADFYTTRTGRAMGAGPLLGLADGNGNSTITKSNGLWKNVNNAVDRFFPILAKLQGTSTGKFDAETLVWKDIVLGVLEIGDTSIHASGMGGVSNFIYRLLSIICTAPIQTDTVVKTAYSVVQGLINGLFGPRYSGQTRVVIPNSTSTTPFDDLMKKNTMIGASAKDPGSLIKLALNFIEFTGVGAKNNQFSLEGYPDTILPGVAFVLVAVNSFISLFPALGEHELKMATASFADPVVTGFGSTTNNTSSSKVIIKNNSVGLNLAYVDGMKNDKIVQFSRNYVKINSVRISGANTNATIQNAAGTRIAPGEKLELSTTTYYTTEGDADTSPYTAIINYDIVDQNGKVKYSNLTTYAYQVLSGATSWKEVVYPGELTNTGIYKLNSKLQSNAAGVGATYQGYQSKCTAKFGSVNPNKLIANYPANVVVSTSDLGAVDTLGVRLKNIKSGNNNSQNFCNAIYYYETGDVKDDGTGTTVTLDSTNAIPVFDEKTGNILKREFFDYTTNKNAANPTWNTNGGAGFTQSEINGLLDSFTDAEKEGFSTRVHVAFKFADAVNNGMIAAYHKNARGEYQYIYLKNGTGDYAYQTLLPKISVRGPVKGLYLNNQQYTVGVNAESTVQFLKYDGSKIAAQDVQAKIVFFQPTASAIGDFQLSICDTNNANAVQNKADELASILANYKETDFTDKTAFLNAQEVIKEAYGVTATPVTPNNIETLNDKTELTYTRGTSTSAYGMAANNPLTTTEYNKLTDAVKGLIYYNDADGHYYADENYKAPVYSTTKLKSGSVLGNVDTVGMPVTKNDDGVYCSTNTKQYVRAWNTKDYAAPYFANTTTQATDAAGKKLYNQIQWTYYTAQGIETNAGGNWVIKAPKISYQMPENKKVGTTVTENRGIYTQTNDKLVYTLEVVYDAINDDMAKELFDQVSVIRSNLDFTNFEVVTFNKMAKIANTIEKNYSIDITYNKPQYDEAGAVVKDAEGNIVFNTDVTYTDRINFRAYDGYKKNTSINIVSEKVVSNLSSTQINAYIDLFNSFMSKVVERGYEGKQLEAEILCASGNAYNKLNVTPAVKDNTGKVTTDAVIKKGTGAAAPAFGKWAADGTLVNEGSTIYTAESWSNYVNALADAVKMAQDGNGSYTYKAKNYYKPNDKAGYTAQVSDCYYVDSVLQYAEINLDPLPPVEEITVSGKIVVATDLTGTAYTNGVGGINIYSGDTIVATSADDGTFTATVPVGTTELKVVGDSTIDRTVTLSGAASVADVVIPVVICDYNKDGAVNTTDKIVLTSAFTDYNVYCDFNCDGVVNATDTVVFKGYFGKAVAYNALALD